MGIEEEGGSSLLNSVGAQETNSLWWFSIRKEEREGLTTFVVKELR